MNSGWPECVVPPMVGTPHKSAGVPIRGTHRAVHKTYHVAVADAVVADTSPDTRRYAPLQCPCLSPGTYRSRLARPRPPALTAVMNVIYPWLTSAEARLLFVGVALAHTRGDILVLSLDGTPVSPFPPHLSGDLAGRVVVPAYCPPAMSAGQPILTAPVPSSRFVSLSLASVRADPIGGKLCRWHTLVGRTRSTPRPTRWLWAVHICL